MDRIFAIKFTPSCEDIWPTIGPLVQKALGRHAYLYPEAQAFPTFMIIPPGFQDMSDPLRDYGYATWCSSVGLTAKCDCNGLWAKPFPKKEGRQIMTFSQPYDMIYTFDFDAAGLTEIMEGVKGEG